MGLLGETRKKTNNAVTHLLVLQSSARCMKWHTGVSLHQRCLVQCENTKAVQRRAFIAVVLRSIYVWKGPLFDYKPLKKLHSTALTTVGDSVEVSSLLLWVFPFPVLYYNSKTNYEFIIFNYYVTTFKLNYTVAHVK